jgi:hypothetical protein
MPGAEDDNSDCFVVSPIGEIGTAIHKRARNVLDYIIKPAAQAAGLRAVRADDLAQPGSITTQIIQQLISARAVVADLTDLNPNVFYELAVRDSFAKPVVLIAEEGTKLPFDLIQQRTIFFDSTDLSSAIPAQKRIEQALRESLDDPGSGSPVQAAADLSSLRTGNAEERQVAELKSQVERMGRDLSALHNVLPRPFRPSPTELAAISEGDMSSVTSGTLLALWQEGLLSQASRQNLAAELQHRGLLGAEG